MGVQRSAGVSSAETPKGIQAALDFLASPRTRGMQARDFVDTSLLEEIQKSGDIDRLYGRQSDLLLV